MNAEMDRPTGLPIRHQMLAASTMPMASHSRPTPSRRCSGSRSRAPFPNRRAVNPVVPATTIHAAASACPIHWIRIRMGSRVAGFAGGRRPLVRLAGRFLPLRGLRLADEPPRRAEFDPDPERDRAGRPDEVRGLRWAARSGSARTSAELSPRGRVKPLGARVAMMTTLTNKPHGPKNPRRRVAAFRRWLTRTSAGWASRCAGRSRRRAVTARARRWHRPDSPR